jgi:hypothetical protein
MLKLIHCHQLPQGAGAFCVATRSHWLLPAGGCAVACWQVSARPHTRHSNVGKAPRAPEAPDAVHALWDPQGRRRRHSQVPEVPRHRKNKKQNHTCRAAASLHRRVCRRYMYTLQLGRQEHGRGGGVFGAAMGQVSSRQQPQASQASPERGRRCWGTGAVLQQLRKPQQRHASNVRVCQAPELHPCPHTEASKLGQ